MEKSIPVEEIQDGMILTRAVENANGMVLCGKDTKLTTKHIARFQNRGVTTVYIQSEVGISPEEMDKRIDAAKKRFAAVVPGDSFDAKLKTVVMDYLLQKKEDILSDE